MIKNKGDNSLPSREGTEFDSEQVIKAIVNTAKSYKAHSLLLGLNANGLITTHLENISVASGINIVVTLFNQLCDFEVNTANTFPPGSDAHKAREKKVVAIEEMRAAFIEAIRTFNKKSA